MKDYDQALKYEIFQKEEYALAREDIKKADLIFDIGGHIGFFSLRCLHFNPQVKIHYFEVFPQSVKKAKENLQKYEKQITFNAFGVAKETRSYNFLFNSEKTMQSSQISSFLNPNGTIEQVLCKNLNEYIEDQQTKKIDLIKIDIEGMEYEVLLNLSEKNREKIKSLICEIHLLNDQHYQSWENLQNKLKQHFQSITIQKNSYSEKILLCFAKNPRV